METSGKRRILMLHGHGQCAYTMSRMLAPIISECDQEIDFVFLDAPTALVPVDFSHDYGSTSSDVHDSRRPKPTSTPSYPPTSRAWFKIQNFAIEQESMRESIEFLKEVLRENQFEAIVGFSQGAALAELIAASLEQPHMYPDFCNDGKAPHPPLKYIVAISGFLLRGPCTEWGSTTSQIAELDSSYFINTPALHVLGRTDVVVPRERSDLFMAYSNYKRIEEHVGGHFIPTTLRWRQFFIEFFKDPFAEIKSPSTSRKRQSFVPLLKANDMPVPPMAIGRTLLKYSSVQDTETKPSRTLVIEPIFTNFADIRPAMKASSVQQGGLHTPTLVNRPSRPLVPFAFSSSSPTWTPDSPFEVPEAAYVSMAGAFIPGPEDGNSTESGHSDGTLTPSDSSEPSQDASSTESDSIPSPPIDVKSYSVAGRLYQGLLIAAGLSRNILRAPIP
ncbi:hypothetical protein K435DRAFT_784766 [Dendrothele bispora CBS 962.96]|uniref:Serine hydrolase domain-containing protein n=1 Tax=Dendrothele bispora (strain CBS 962.96) TaxID=1314807 RepID=A0A4V4HC73_DENBC|nr:hypothetical protein K435DRAFT_784766 [Dendrothele bispora CBS 962.96]